MKMRKKENNFHSASNENKVPTKINNIFNSK